MKKIMKKIIMSLIVVATLLSGSIAKAKVWQWSDDPGIKNGRNYLWIPEDCKRIRGLIFFVKNLSEGSFADSELIRDVCRKERIGIVYISQDPSSWGAFTGPNNFAAYYNWYSPLGKEKEEECNKLIAELRKSDKEVSKERKAEIQQTLVDMSKPMLEAAEKELNNHLKRLADISGYPEVANAPLLIISHSMGGLPSWFMPFYLKDRMWGSIPFKTGSRGNPPNNLPNSRMDGVPLMYINQITVDPNRDWNKSDDGLNPSRRKENNYLVGRVFDWGGTHFDTNEELIKIVAMFIQKASKYRLSAEIPTDGSLPKLKDLKPEDGYLVTSLKYGKNYELAPEKSYKGDKSKASWFFDKEMAETAVKHFLTEQDKKPQSMTVVINGKPVEPFKAAFGGVDVDGKAGLANSDGFTFQIDSTFWPERKIDWDWKSGMEQVGHSNNGKIEILTTGGSSIQKINDNTFRHKFFNSAGYPNNWLVLYHPGDKEYARTAYQINFWCPETRRDGKNQKITFEPIPDVKLGTKSIKLNAKSDVDGQKVEFHVVSGPVELVNGDTLKFTKIPVNAKFPVKVIVIAYQMGRSIEPKVKRSEQVRQEFNIIK